MKKNNNTIKTPKKRLKNSLKSKFKHRLSGGGITFREVAKLMPVVE